jgi:cell division septal protein FtsQ
MNEKPSAEEHSSRTENGSTRTGVKRPLVTLVLALMLGLVAAAWGLHIPRTWLLPGLTGLLGILLVLWILATPQR